MTEPRTTAGPDWRTVWEQAASATAGRPPFESVYSGPAWEEAGSSGAPEVRLWKMAVLERRSQGGAEHWGHLFLVVGDQRSQVRILRKGGWGSDAGQLPLEPLPPLPGLPLQIWLRPRSVEAAPHLRAFALAFQGHAAVLTKD